MRRPVAAPVLPAASGMLLEAEEAFVLPLAKRRYRAIERK